MDAASTERIELGELMAAAAAETARELSGGEALLDVLELVSRVRPELVGAAAETLAHSALATGLAEVLGASEPARMGQLVRQGAAALDLLERNWASGRRVLRESPSPFLAALCGSRARNVEDEQRRLVLTVLERSLVAEVGR